MFNFAGLAARLGLWGRNQHVVNQAVADLAAEDAIETPREVRVKELRAHLSSIVVPEHMLGKAPRAALKPVITAFEGNADKDNVVPFPVVARRSSDPVAAPISEARAASDVAAIAMPAGIARRQGRNYAHAIQASHSRPKRPAKAAAKTAKAKAQAKAKAAKSARKRPKHAPKTVVWLAAR